MHWCADENYALLSTLPFVGYYFRKLHVWYHNKKHHPCHTHGCADSHVEHARKPISLEPTEEDFTDFIHPEFFRHSHTETDAYALMYARAIEHMMKTLNWYLELPPNFIANWRAAEEKRDRKCSSL